MAELDWYFKVEDREQDVDLCDIYDKNIMYEKLAIKIASNMFDCVYNDVYSYAHKEESFFYGNNPTIWDQLMIDVEHGDFMNREQLEKECSKYLEKYSELEIYLLWVYAFDHSKLYTIYDNKPELSECMNTITNIVLDKLYIAAEQENLDNDIYSQIIN